MQPDFVLLVDDAGVHCSGAQIDAAVELVLRFVKSHGQASFA
jgi:hypothetical protein